MIPARSRFRGCLLGSLLGDCLGAPFESQNWSDNGIDHEEIKNEICPSVTSNVQRAHFSFTDDTAMSKSVCSSLLHCKNFNCVDMATRFTTEYIKEPNRGYGRDICRIFKQWNKLLKSYLKLDEDNVFKPSIRQFDGKGSYGNGAAMRVAAVALFARSKEECLKVAKDTALLTHSHRHGYNGAMLQALAVYKALVTRDIDRIKFVDELIEEMLVLEGGIKNNMKSYSEEISEKEQQDLLYSWTTSEEFTFTQQLLTIKELLQFQETNKGESDKVAVISKLGRDILAQQAVPTAIYSFLRNIEDSFENTLIYCISLGGDTDTIAAMCAAMTGAYFGDSDFPKSWVDACECSNEMLSFADQLYDLRLEDY